MSIQSAIDVRVWRGVGTEGQWKRFLVNTYANQTVLDVVTWIQRHLAPDLAYRFACRVGVCGSCAMMVNGEPRWTCRTHVKQVLSDGQLSIGPLRNLPVVRDLVCDMTPFFDRWREADGHFVPSADRCQPLSKTKPETPARRAADAAIECINCAVCFAACDVVDWKPGYLGPAALNRAWSLVNDERDGGNRERLEAISGDVGCHNCHSHNSCTHFCPNLLDPAASIAGLKRVISRAALKGEL